MASVASGWLASAACVPPGRELLAAGRRVLGVAAALVALGLVMTYSSSSARLAGVGHDPNGVLVKQACWALLAALACAVMARVPLEALGRWSKPVLTTVIVLLVVTMVLGVSVNGSRRWVSLAGLRFQPSEMLKLALLLYMADALARREQRACFDPGAPAVRLLLPVLAGVGLVFIQPDLGTSIFLVAECIVVLGLAGVRPSRVAPAFLMVLPLLLVVAWAKFPHVQRRFEMWTGGADAGGTQVKESLLAIGSGGLLGRGLGEGTQKLYYLPESNTDFIGAVLGEELGFVGCAAVIAGFMAIAWYGRKITLGARALSPQAVYLAGGAAFVIAFQAVLNLAVVTNSTPTKGIPLPFISVGGSNLVLMLSCVGLLVNVSRRAASAAADPDVG